MRAIGAVMMSILSFGFDDGVEDHANAGKREEKEDESEDENEVAGVDNGRTGFRDGSVA